MPQNDTSLTPAPVGQQVLGGNGLLTTPWSQFFQRLYARVGGGSTNPLNNTNDSVGTLQDDVDSLQSQISDISNELFTVSQQQELDHASIVALQSALAPGNGSWTPSFTGAAETGVVVYAGTWKSIGEELFWEVVIEASAGSVAFSSAEITNMPIAASRPGTFAAVSTSAYADHGNGVVVATSAFVPNFTLTSGTAVLSGRYIR